MAKLINAFRNFANVVKNYIFILTTVRTWHVMLCIQFGVAQYHQAEYLHGTARVSEFVTRLTSLMNFVTAGDANMKSNFLQISKKDLRTSVFLFMSCMSSSAGTQVTFHTILTSFWYCTTAVWLKLLFADIFCAYFIMRGWFILLRSFTSARQYVLFTNKFGRLSSFHCRCF